MGKIRRLDKIASQPRHINDLGTPEKGVLDEIVEKVGDPRVLDISASAPCPSD
jgi:hypothetical protein